MLRILSLAALVAALVIVPALPASAQVATRSVPVSLNLGAPITFSVQAKNVSDDQDAAGVGFGAIASGQNFAAAAQYVEINVTAPGASWRVKSYTNNGPIAGQTFRSGLVGGADSVAHRVPTKWYATDAPVPGGMAFDAATADSWVWHKDPGDFDWNPNMDYINVASGTGANGSISNGANSGTAITTPIVYYIGVLDLAAAAPDNYSTTLVFDLIQL